MQVDGTAARLVTAAASTALMEDIEPGDQQAKLMTAFSTADHLKTPASLPQLMKTPAAIQASWMDKIWSYNIFHAFKSNLIRFYF